MTLVCAKCGYDLEGLGNRQCPECGSRRRRAKQSALAREWVLIVHLAFAVIVGGLTTWRLARQTTTVDLFAVLALIMFAAAMASPYVVNWCFWRIVVRGWSQHAYLAALAGLAWSAAMSFKALTVDLSQDALSALTFIFGPLFYGAPGALIATTLAGGLIWLIGRFRRGRAVS